MARLCALWRQVGGDVLARQVEGGDQPVGRIPATVDPDRPFDELPFVIGDLGQVGGGVVLEPSCTLPSGPMSAMTWSPTLTTTWGTDPVMTAGALAGVSYGTRAFGVHWPLP